MLVFPLVYIVRKFEKEKEDKTMNKITIGKYTRISKATARKLFLDGKTIAIVPCKCDPDNKFFPAFTANRRDKEEFVIDEIGMKNYFDNMVNSFEYYNCQYNETGKYAAFYTVS